MARGATGARPRPTDGGSVVMSFRWARPAISLFESEVPRGKRSSFVARALEHELTYQVVRARLDYCEGIEAYRVGECSGFEFGLGVATGQGSGCCAHRGPCVSGTVCRRSKVGGRGEDGEGVREREGSRKTSTGRSIEGEEWRQRTGGGGATS